MLSILFIHRLSLKNHGFSPKDSPLLFYKEPDLSMLLYENFTPIRTYGKTDTLVMVNLLEAVNSIIYAARSNTEAIKVIVDYVSALLFDIDKHIKNLLDRNEISKMVERIEECLEDSSKLYDFG